MQFSAILAILAMTSSVFAAPTQSDSQNLGLPDVPTQTIPQSLLPDILAFKAELEAKAAKLETKETKRSPDLVKRSRKCWGCIVSQVFSDYGAINTICCHEGAPCEHDKCVCDIC